MYLVPGVLYVIQILRITLSILIMELSDSSLWPIFVQIYIAVRTAIQQNVITCKQCLSLKGVIIILKQKQPHVTSVYQSI